MTPLEQITVRAQHAANREGRPMAVLNLNSYSPLYVVRDWDDSFEGDRQLVARVEPKEAPRYVIEAHGRRRTFASFEDANATAEAIFQATGVVVAICREA
jgi:hypothetical protein